MAQVGALLGSSTAFLAALRSHTAASPALRGATGAHEANRGMAGTAALASLAGVAMQLQEGNLPPAARLLQ